jgi:hypothetical protein
VNATDKQTGVKPTIVLVHGAFADASRFFLPARVSERLVHPLALGERRTRVGSRACKRVPKHDLVSGNRDDSRLLCRL